MNENTHGTYTFTTDIKTGQQGEAFIRTKLESLGYKFIEERKDNLYDLKMSYQVGSGKTITKTYEIKTDVYPKDTGNLVVEFECRGKNSGINVTQADYFVTYFPHQGEIWNIETDKLKKLIEEKKPHVFSKSGDKDSNTKLYRLVKEDVRKYFKIHKA